MNKWLKYASWIGLILIVLIFIQAGALKLMGVQMMVEIIDKLGFPAWFRIVIGILEISGAIALLVRYSSWYAALLLATIMIGAITSTIIKGQILNVILPAILLCILVWIAIVRKPVNHHKPKTEIEQNCKTFSIKG